MRYPLFLLVLSTLIATAAASPSPPQGLFIFSCYISLPFNQVAAQPLPFNHLQLDFWAPAKTLGDKVRILTEEKLHEVAFEIPAASTKLDEFHETMPSAVTASKNLRSDIERRARDGPTTEEISHKLSREPAPILENFKCELILPLPGDHNARDEEGAKMVDWLLIEVEHVLVGTLLIPEAGTRENFREVKPHVKHVFLVWAALLIPESSLLRPVLSLFGFDPYGPVKGSPGAWAQRRFWNAAVAEGSWFTWLQRWHEDNPPPPLAKERQEWALSVWGLVSSASWNVVERTGVELVCSFSCGFQRLCFIHEHDGYSRDGTPCNFDDQTDPGFWFGDYIGATCDVFGRGGATWELLGSIANTVRHS